MRDGLAVHVATGALGGVLGEAVLHRSIKVTQKLPERLKPTALLGDPDEFLMSKLEELLGAPLPRGARDGLILGLRWGRGVAVGAALGLLASRLRRHSA